MSQYILKLFITGQTEKSHKAVANLQRLFDQMGVEYQLIVVDVLEQPECAEQDRVLATPTLIRVMPLPARRIIGDLSDVERVRIGLGL